MQNHTQCFIITCKRRESEKEFVCVCVYVELNHYAIHLKLTKHYESTILQFFQKGHLSGINNFLVQLSVYYAMSRGQRPVSAAFIMALKESTKAHT